MPWLALLPLAAFLVFAGVAGYFLASGRDASVLPSPLIGRAAPNVDLPPLPGAAVPAPADLPASASGGVRVVNAWASWCGPCRAEHAQLMALADEVTLIGLATKDEPADSRRFLEQLGNPFDAIGVDANGRAMIDWGVVALPETHVIAPDGTVAYKHTGPILPEHMDDLRAAIAAAGAR